ncbi:MAG: CRP/FNR family cyclic AMP-dependent transcriptional regulator [Bacteroidia bacterium]|jgi:CRP/FNR family cyclic AMP-dependent transcriptional regulator
MDIQANYIHLEQFQLFEGIDRTELDRISSFTTLRSRPKNSYIYHPGDPSEVMFILKEGRIKVGNYSKDGREVIKRIVQPGEIFGEMGLAGEITRREFAIALKEEASFYMIYVADLKEVIRDNAELGMRLITRIGSRIRTTEKRLESIIFKDSKTRVVEFIQELGKTIGLKCGDEMLLQHFLTHQDIANITGTSRQFVTSVLNDLKRLKIIKFDRTSILISDPLGLDKVAVTGLA